MIVQILTTSIMSRRTMKTTVSRGQIRSVSPGVVKCHFELLSLGSQAYLQVCT